MNNIINKKYKILKNIHRYFLAFLVMSLIFLINISIPSETITSESCLEKTCKKALLEKNLTDDTPKYFINDIFDSNKGEFYRVIFRLSSNKKTTISIFITNPSDQEKKIKELEINGDLTAEIVFSTDKTYTDIAFYKNSLGDGADIAVGQVLLSKMNITREEEISSLVPTIIGDADREIEDQKQLGNNHSFSQLQTPEIIFGQVFKPRMDYLTKVGLDFDIVKQGGNGGKKYTLELREVEYESADVPEIKSSPLATLRFSLDDLEKYRQQDGKFIFPLIAKVDKNKHYFIGINNDRADVNDFNYILPKGSSENYAYPEGSLAIKFKKKSYSAPGSLYFKTYGFIIKEFRGISILPGAIIEDRGKGQVYYSYQSQKNNYELLNIDSYSGNINFDDEKKVIKAEIDPESENDTNFVYNFDTVYPIKNWSVYCSQGDILWNKIKLSYSYDKREWIEIPSEISQGKENRDYQVFDYSLSEKKTDNKNIYLKIEPAKDKLANQKTFGIKDFHFQSELIKKN